MMGTETEPKSAVEKLKYFNRLDEAFGMLFLGIWIDLIFHVDSIGTPNEFWLRHTSLFGKTGEMSVHQLKNELISPSPSHYETIQYFFTKYKVLVIQLKQCGMDNIDHHIIFSILSELWHDYSVSISTCHSSKLTTRNWRMLAL